MTKEELANVLLKHGQWLIDRTQGERACLDYEDLAFFDLQGANLRCASLVGIVAQEANFRGADLMGADLRYSFLQRANFSGADLRDATLRDADLQGADLTGAKYFLPMVCPSHGAFVAWKKCANDVLVKLLIPEDAKRVSSTSRKCRASKAVVLEIEGANVAFATYRLSYFEHRRLPGFVYCVGETVYPDFFDEDRFNECSHGIHFFITREEAENY